MALSRTTGASLLAPEDVAELVVRPLAAESVAIRTGTLRQTDRSEYRVPVVTADPSAAWVAEGDPIPLVDGAFSSVEIRPTKIGAITVVSSEEIDDAEVAPLEALGNGLVRQLAQRIDEAWFGALPAPAQSGLAALAAANGSQVGTVSAGASFANADFAAEAASKIEQAGGQVTAFVAAPTTALALSKMKAASGSNVPLLAPGGDAAQPTRRLLNGVPLAVSAAVAPNTLWAYDSSTAFVVVRRNITLDVDRSVFFQNDQAALRLTARIGFGFAAPARIVKITTS